MLGMFLYDVLTVDSSRFFPLESESRTLSVRALLFYTFLSIIFIDGLFFYLKKEWFHLIGRKVLLSNISKLYYP